jgi:F0F1-type ATP synthase delta subunit
MSSRYKDLVRKLVQQSLNDSGIVDESLVKNVLSGLKECKLSRHKDILQAYLIEIRKTLRLQIVEVEIGCQANDSLTSKLKSKIDANSMKSVDLRVSRNDHLIAGYRLRIEDDVFEDSIHSRLTKLTQSLTS